VARLEASCASFPDGLRWDSDRLSRGRVARLVETQLDPAGESDGRQQAPALVADRPGDLDPLGLEGGHRGGDVVAQQVQLGPAAGGSAKISQPPPASTDRVPSTLARAARVASASSL
jgi:hypothetical protein